MDASVPQHTPTHLHSFCRNPPTSLPPACTQHAFTPPAHRHMPICTHPLFLLFPYMHHHSPCTHSPALLLYAPTCPSTRANLLPWPPNAPTHSLARMHAPTCPPPPAVCTYLHPSGTNLPPCPPACTHSLPVHAQMVPLHAPPTCSCTHLHPCSLHVPMGPSACTHPPSLPPAHTLGPLFQFSLDKPGCVFSSWVIVPETLVHYLPGVIITEMNYILVSLPLFSLPLDSVIIEWPYPVCLGSLELVLSYPMPWLQDTAVGGKRQGQVLLRRPGTSAGKSQGTPSQGRRGAQACSRCSQGPDALTGFTT
ncbi:pollen-specific leucine-rich repeat extensin-like protein 3 [Felis catus]|uniref:pollen-specific leucine-rich repeat extensin-like protein 3 n=1 Tax=Felis catus TaxID=9685 RepID=UPI001D1A1BF8|nr:pollen-specific leucine-rich repeat extensin-like protein 3 [Felis catus]XP_044897717.1 pollen-specific leucine-rich repeat extensin-like protein 3 [Felis catus]